PAQTDVAARDAEAADEILRRTQVRAGFCLDVDGGDAGLALALANRTDLQIYVLVHSDAELVAARRRLLAAGMYGTRVMVHRAPSTGPLYGRYFADLVISSRSTRDGSAEWDERKLPPELRPYGGVACSGRTGAMRTLVRGELARAGSWTHQYADLGNTSCSTDEIVQGNLHALWFRDVDLEMPQRHGRGPAPLYHGGRMFVEGLDAVRAVDAYNGRNLWTFPLPGILKSYSADHLAGTAVTGSNLCVAGDHVYVHDKQRCYRLDAATGQQRGAFTTPAGTTSASERDREPGLWGFVACDGRRLFGSIVNPAHRVRYAYLRSDMSELWGESSSFFVLDSVTGKPAWEYRAEASIRNNAITIGRDLVFLVDRALAKEDVWDPQDLSRKLPAVKEVHHPAGNLIALEADTGTVRWRRDGEGFGTMLAYSAEHDVLLLCFQPTRFKLPSEVGGRLAAYQGTTGKPLWQKEGDYVTRPLINDRTIYAQGGAWDLLTGDERPFTLQRSYGCGQIAASKNLLVFRSATLGYLDLSRGSGVENYGGIRPGCWINALPAGGLVLVPDASAGCQCSYQNRSWMALAGDAESP
ncbi:MAG: PQQ-binding-like beta-propeller repeat protein, partial [Pirellulaceae bacterium]